jgi:hypothetical protein
MNITIGDCSKSKTIELLYVELPEYCQESIAETLVTKKYTFFIKEEPYFFPFLSNF